MPNKVARAKRLAGTSSAALLLLRVEFWWKKWGNGPTVMRAGHWAADAGLSPAEFTKALQQLVDRGLVITSRAEEGRQGRHIIGLSEAGVTKLKQRYLPDEDEAPEDTSWYTPTLDKVIQLWRRSRIIHAGWRWVSLVPGDWEKAMDAEYKKLGKDLLELQDQGLLILQKQPYRDEQRLAARPSPECLERLKGLKTQEPLQEAA